jgi:L-glyceraldehyde 3-phosphate reductase
MMYLAEPTRYDKIPYRRTGRSGLVLPELSLGLWHNFGDVDPYENGRAILRKAFDSGITHFDLANNYGPPPGSAEEMFGRMMQTDFAAYRDELIISTKAGYRMWPGPYGEWSSRKYLIASLNQSLKRMKIDYVDIFYSHRFDPDTPLEETMMALDQAVRQGKALYAGISSYGPEETRQAAAILKDLGTPCLIHQPKYSMFERWAEQGLMDFLGSEGIGCIAFSPLAQGLLTNRYLAGVASDSRAGKPNGGLREHEITPERLEQISALHTIAQRRGQSLAQMAIAWLLKDKRVTSVLIGVSKMEQLTDCLGALHTPQFSDEELMEIEVILWKNI